MDGDGEGYQRLAISIVVEAIRDVRQGLGVRDALLFLRNDWARFLVAGVMAADAFDAFVERLAAQPDAHHPLIDAIECAYALRDAPDEIAEPTPAGGAA